MPYPRKLLNDGERLALDLRPHWWYFSKHIASGIPLFLVGALILFGTHGDVQRYLGIVWAIVAVAWGLWLATRYLKWNFTHFVVTNDRVIFRTGALAKRGVEIPMERINNINFHQGIWERLIGAGDLDIESAGRDGQSHFDDIWHPDAVQQELYRQMEANAKKRAAWANPATANAVASHDTIPDQIRQLADLRDRGVISAEEFDRKKAELLERM